MDVYKKRTSCAICENTSLQTILSFGEVPLAGSFPKDETEIRNDKSYELSLVFCNTCGLVQTDSIIDSDFLFKDYRYLSSVGLAKHFNDVANYYTQRFLLNENSLVIEIGSNDGVLLVPFKNNNIKAIGFEPSVNVSSIAKSRGCEVVNDYFNEANVVKYLENEKADLMVANNCFAHIDDIQSIVRGVKLALKKDSFFVIEVHYLKKLIEEFQYDFIYHEHLYYYSLVSLKHLFAKNGMSIVDFEEINIHSGSIRVFVQNTPNVVSLKVEQQILFEQSLGLHTIAYFNDFGNAVNKHIHELKSQLQKLKENGASIVGYGASGRANMLLNVSKIDSKIIDFIIDESPERYNRYIPGVLIPILPYNALETAKPEYIIILAWNYADMIMEKLKQYPVKFIIPFPNYKII